jgi:integrase
MMRSEKGARIVRLTDRNVGTLPAVGKRRTDYTDSLLSGFVLRVSPTGHRSYSVVYGTGPAKTRFTIGLIGRMTLAQAREKAREILARAELGGDPQADRVQERRKAAASTLRMLADSFLAAKPRKRGGSWRPSTEAVYRVAFANYILPRFGNVDPDTIKAPEVRVFLDGIAKKVPIMANRVLEAFRRSYTWGLSRGFVTTTPFIGIEKPAQARKAVRTYTNDEIRAMFAAVVGTQLDDLVPLLFHTATRSHETRAMRWSQVDLERAVWRIPPELAKTGEVLQRAHDVPLSRGAVTILKRIQERQLAAQVVGIKGADFVFPAPTRAGHMDKPNKATTAMKDALGIEDRGFLHHIRRTVADRLKTDLGVAPWVVEAILGHAQDRLAETYMPSSPLSLMREALDAWSAHLASILKDKPRRRNLAGS